MFGSVPIVRKKVQKRTQELKLFKRYVDVLVCTVMGYPLEYLGFANSLHKNLQFNLETPNGSGDMTFLDPNINVNKDMTVSCHWYQKSADTGKFLNFRSCAPLKLKKKYFKGLCIELLMRPVIGNPLM